MATDNADKLQTNGPSISMENAPNPSEKITKDYETWTLLEDGNGSGRTPSHPAPSPVQPLACYPADLSPTDSRIAEVLQQMLGMGFHNEA